MNNNLEVDNEKTKQNIMNKKTIFKLGELVNFKGGNSKYTKNFIENNKGKYPHYSAKILNQGIRGYINEYTHKGSYLYYLTGGAVGRVFYIENKKFSISPDIRLIIPKDEKILHQVYLFYYLRSQYKELIKLKRGTAIPKLPQHAIANFPIKVPNILEQIWKSDRIKYLELDLLKMKHLLQQMKHLLQQMKHLLQKALNYAFCNLGDLEPNIMKLGDVCNVLVGKTPPTKKQDFWDNYNGYNWLTIKDITNKNLSTERKISRKAIKEINLPITSNNSLLFCFKGTLRLDLFPHGYRFNEAIAMLEPNNKVLLKEYLMYYLKTKIDKFKRTHRNTILVCLSKKVINDIEIPIPNIENQQKIINFIHPLYSKLQTIINKTDRLIIRHSELIDKVSDSILNKELFK